jgi:hypothetical protein
MDTQLCLHARSAQRWRLDRPTWNTIVARQSGYFQGSLSNEMPPSFSHAASTSPPGSGARFGNDAPSLSVLTFPELQISNRALSIHAT